MTVDEEILRENANSERRYILAVARDEIAAIDYPGEGLYLEGCEQGRYVALTIINELMKDLSA